MKYKALFVDVDDTLVLHGIDSLPSKKVIDAITKARESGLHVGLATSRPLHAVQRVIDHLHLTGLHVISGGTQMYDASSKKIIKEVMLPTSAIPDVLSIAQEQALKVGIFDGSKDKVLSDYTAFVDTHVIAMYLPEVNLLIAESVEKKLQTIKHVALHRMLSWDKQWGWFDITHEKATKQYGIEHVAALLGLQTGDIVGVGDGYNDIPLFQAVGLKVAMGNAVTELKEKADLIVPTVSEDGLAFAIHATIFHHER